MENNKILINFFQEIIDKLEKDEVEHEKLVDLSKFMLKYKFEENYKFDDNLLKFLTMGWYVYSNMEKK